LFEQFVTSKAGSLGVGLSICRVIVEAHGGRLLAEDNPGGGSIISLHHSRWAACALMTDCGRADDFN